MNPASEDVLSPFGRVAILGLGIIGGSLARALARLPAAPFRLGWSPDAEEREAALEAGALDLAPSSWGEAVREADLVVVAAPLAATCSLIADLGPILRADTVVTDTASLKAVVRDAALRAGLVGRWVGGHPMCGSEASGFAASRADLYEGARVWLVPQEGAEAAAERVADFWRSVGARPEWAGAEEHDARMVLASHLPQLTANALGLILERGGVAPSDLGPGGRDMTRLAASGPAMWRDLLGHAPAGLPLALRALGGEIEHLATLVERRDTLELEALLTRTRAWRKSE